MGSEQPGCLAASQSENDATAEPGSVGSIANERGHGGDAEVDGVTQAGSAADLQQGRDGKSRAGKLLFREGVNRERKTPGPGSNEIRQCPMFGQVTGQFRR